MSGGGGGGGEEFTAKEIKLQEETCYTQVNEDLKYCIRFWIRPPLSYVYFEQYSDFCKCISLQTV